MTPSLERYLGWLEAAYLLRLEGDEAGAAVALEEARARRPEAGDAGDPAEPVEASSWFPPEGDA